MTCAVGTIVDDREDPAALGRLVEARQAIAVAVDRRRIDVAGWEQFPGLSAPSSPVRGPPIANAATPAHPGATRTATRLTAGFAQARRGSGAGPRHIGWCVQRWFDRRAASSEASRLRSRQVAALDRSDP